jgi:hypothetical protein
MYVCDSVVDDLNDHFFNWRDVHISNWKKVLRIIFLHGFIDIDCRGYSANESARRLLILHEKDLKEDEIDFLKSLLV